MTNKANLVIAGRDATRAAFDSVKRSIGDTATSFKSLQGAAAGAFAAFAAISQVREFGRLIDQADELGKSAQKVGIGTQALAAYQFAAKLAGIENEAFVDSLGRLNVRMADAVGGNEEAAAAFDSMGVKLRDTNGDLRDTGDLLKDVADRFARYKDGPEKTALAVELFGRSGKALIPLLNQGAAGFEALREEADRLGVTLVGKLSQDAEAFNDNITKLKASLDGAKNALLEELLPGLVEFTNQLVEATKATGNLGTALLSMIYGAQVSGPLDRQLDQVRQAIRERKELLSTLQEPAGSLGDVFVKYFTPSIVQKGLTFSLKGLEGLKRQIEQQVAQQGAFESGFSGSSAVRQTGRAPVVAKPDKDRVKDGKAFLENLERQVSKLKENEFEVLRLEAAQKGVAKAAEPWIQQLQAAKDDLRLQKSLQDAITAALAERAQLEEAMGGFYSRGSERVRDIQEEAKTLAMSADELKKYLALRDLEREYNEAASKLSEHSEALKDLGKQYELLKQKTADSIDAMLKKQKEWGTGWEQAYKDYKATVEDQAGQARQVFTDTVQGMEDALVEFVKTGKLSFKDLADSIIEDLARIWIKQNITGPLAELMGAKGSGGGESFLFNAIGSLFDFGPGVIGRASGGPVTRGSLFRVNELRPEVFSTAQGDYLMTGGARGSIRPWAGGGGGVVFSPTYIVQGGDRAAVRRDMEAIAARSHAQFLDRLQRGGPEARVVGMAY